jgi:hypothetical protein
MLRFTNKNELATKASYQVTHMLAKRMKPFSDAKLIKKCMKTVVNTLFCNFSNFKEIHDQISSLQFLIIKEIIKNVCDPQIIFKNYIWPILQS